jgi:hypothetical protein
MGALKNDGGPTAKRKSAQMTQMSEGVARQRFVEAFGL